MQNFSSPGKLATYPKVKKATVGFYSLQERLNSKTIFICHDILVSNAQRPRHSGLEA